MAPAKSCSVSSSGSGDTCFYSSPTEPSRRPITAVKQALRPCVIFRKVTNCFRSEWAAHLYADIRFYADIRSVIETARRRAIAALHAK
jgi:hypothetical protein